MAQRMDRITALHNTYVGLDVSKSSATVGVHVFICAMGISVNCSSRAVSHSS